jgi:transcriptional regulator with GAF, ATPase, and Fis domain
VNIYCKKIGKTIQAIPNKTINALENYTWPGNVRELENIVERGIVTTIGNKLQLGDWFKNVPVAEDGKPSPTLNEHETDYILNILEKTNWRIRGKNGAAQILGLKPTTLESRIERLGIKRQ